MVPLATPVPPYHAASLAWPSLDDPRVGCRIELSKVAAPACGIAPRRAAYAVVVRPLQPIMKPRFCFLVLPLFMACGAPPHAGNLVLETRSDAIRNGVLVQSVGIESFGGTFTPLLQQGCRLPCLTTSTFTTSEEQGTSTRLLTSPFQDSRPPRAARPRSWPRSVPVETASLFRPGTLQPGPSTR